MDIISGIVWTTASLLVTMALVVLFTRIIPLGTSRPDLEVRGLSQKVMVTSLVVYFVALVNLLLIAQQVSLALGTFVIGLVLLVVEYVEPAVRGRGVQAEEGEGWER